MTALYIQGVGRDLPRSMELAGLLAGYSEDEVARAASTGITHLAIETQRFPAEMALGAVREALERSRTAPSNLGLIVVSAIHRHGHKHVWSLASFLQARTGADRALPLNVQQGCNANMLALQLACSHLQCAGERERALVVAADCFENSAFDRINCDYGVLYGDAAGALVVGRQPGALRILGIATESVAAAEGMHRNPFPARETVEDLRSQHDLRESKRRYLVERGRDDFTRDSQRALLLIKQRLLRGDDRNLEHIVFPNLGHELLAANYYPVFDRAEEKSLWKFGRTVGHLGTADQVVGLYELSIVRRVSAGSRILLIGAGAGFSFSGVLLEVTDIDEGRSDV